MPRKLLSFLLLAAVLAACSDPKSTKLPPDLSQLDAVQPQVAQLGEEDRRLFDAYIARYKAAGLFSNVSSGARPASLPAGATIGSAIAEQRYIADAEAAAKKARAAK